MYAGQSKASLLQLPDPCLVAVLRCCAGDPRSVCSAARAHSRLHQAAVEALSSITAVDVNQQQLDCLVDGYLPWHGQHVDSISVRGVGQAAEVRLRELPPALTKLTSLELSHLCLQLQPGSGWQGVLGAAAGSLPLQQLEIEHCTLLDGGEGLAAALALLPGLEHLSFRDNEDADREEPFFPVDLLLMLPQLTYLHIFGVQLQGLDDGTADRQLLSPLTRLLHLQLSLAGAFSITASMLSGAQHLTHLELRSYDERFSYEPFVLSGRTALQHLELVAGQATGGAAGVAQLLSQLQQLQQLTRLALYGSLDPVDSYPPAAAFSALTASSKLQSLDLTGCCLPAAAWQHVFPAGRLPHLRVLDMAHVTGPAAAPEGTRLVSCCPGLQRLDIRWLRYTAGGLAGLQGLSGLQELLLRPAAGSEQGWMEGVCQLTGLRRLDLQESHGVTEGLLLQLTQLQQLTHLSYTGFPNGLWCQCLFAKLAPGDEPVWRQVLLYLREHSDPTVAQQAAAALAQSQPVGPVQQC